MTRKHDYDFQDLPYRNGVIGIVINKNKSFLIIQSVRYNKDEWRFPGGGVKEGETPEKALLRELSEELGINKFRILKKSKIQIKYKWPKDVIERRFIEDGKTFKGQRQTQYFVEFLGNRKEINVNPKEIRNIKWVRYKSLQTHLKFPGQWSAARKTIKELGLKQVN